MATLHITLRDVTLHDAGHYFLTVQYVTRDGEERKVRTEVSVKTATPEFKNRTFAFEVRAPGGVLDEAELQFGAFLVVRSEREAKPTGEKASIKGTAKLAGLCTRQLAELAPKLAAGGATEYIELTHPDGAPIGTLAAELRMDMPPGLPLRASAEQLTGSAYELVLRSAVNLAGLTGGLAEPGAAGRAGSGVRVDVRAVCRGAPTPELGRTRAAHPSGHARFNDTLTVRPPLPFGDVYDGLTLSVAAAGGGEGGELARVHVPLGALRDETPRELRLELAEAPGAALYASIRRLPPSAPTAPRLEAEARQLRADAGLTLPAEGCVTVVRLLRHMGEYAPASMPWHHVYVPPPPAAAEALARAVGAPPAPADVRTVTWARAGGTWPQLFSWGLEGGPDVAIGSDSAVAVELYVPVFLPADAAEPGGDGVEWQLWAHALLPLGHQLASRHAAAAGAGGGSELAVPFELPLVLSAPYDKADLPAPVLAGTLRWRPAALAPPAAPPASADAMALRAPLQPSPPPPPPPIAGAELGGSFDRAAAAAQPHDALLAELAQKQGLVNRLLREVDGRTAALSRCGHELVEAREANGALRAELERVRGALADKESALDRLAADATNAEHIDTAELQRRHRMLGGAYRSEKKRSEELWAQLSQLSAHVGGARRLERAYIALQDAHRAQTAELHRLQAEARDLGKYKRTVASQVRGAPHPRAEPSPPAPSADARVPPAAPRARAGTRRAALSAPPLPTRPAPRRPLRPLSPRARPQEKLIAKLEALVKPALKDAHKGRSADAELAAVRAKLAELERQQADAAGIGTEEHVRLVMRAEQAERRAGATEAEMAESARTHAREVAQLKLRLAEKEAQLMGGFGSLANLALDELPSAAPREVRARRRARAPWSVSMRCALLRRARMAARGRGRARARGRGMAS